MLIISAAAFETKPLQAALAQQTSVDWLTCGVGVPAAAAAVAQAQTLCHDREVLFIGTCGTFAAFTQVTLCRAQTLHWSPTCARLGLSYAVDDTPPLSLNSSGCYNDLPAAEVFCAPNISLTNTLPDAQKGALCVENIEAYTYLSALRKTARTIDVLLGITNAIGKDAHQQWREHCQQAAALTATYVMQRRFSN